jgi:adenylate cyclase
MEIERKFRLQRLPDLSGSESDRIEQGYLAVGAEGEVRLRRKGKGTLLTAKRGAGLARGEAEVEVSTEQFEELWPLTEGRRLRKRRHVQPHDGLEIEIDVFEGELEGLAVAEIEFDSEQQANEFEPPAWLGEEVTGDERFLNENLAVRGLPDA